VGRILLYIAGGYVLLVLVSSALFTGPAGLPLLMLVAVVYFLRRGGGLARLRAGSDLSFSLGRSGTLPALADGGLLAEAQRYARRFESAEPRLLAALPEDPLESAALVAVLSAHLHEPPEAQARLEAEYRERRAQFAAWSDKVHVLGSPDDVGAGGLRGWLDEAEDLAADLSELEAYAEDIQDRAAATEGLLEKALERATRAGAALTAARTDIESVGNSRATSDLRELLDAAQARHREAWSALEKGKERPFSALRFADEATGLADDARRRAARITALPRELERQLAELQPSIEQATADLERVREEFDAAVDSYAPSCWHEIGGFGHAAQRALERARRLRDEATRRVQSADPDQLEQARKDADQARHAVDDAARLRDAIERHLAKLEAAALQGRDRVIQAEQEIDRAWAAVRENDGGTDELLQRAGDLVREARDGLAKPQPDWLTIVELADRGAGLAHEARGGTSSAPAAAGSAHRTLEEARAHAKDARDSAWAHAIVRPDAAEGIRSLLDAAEEAYQAALRAETTAGEESGIEEARAAFDEAEKLAAAFCTEFEGLVEKRSGRRVTVDGHGAHTLVWNFELKRSSRF
jgi:hypothetical protein